MKVHMKNVVVVTVSKWRYWGIYVNGKLTDQDNGPYTNRLNKYATGWNSYDHFNLTPEQMDRIGEAYLPETLEEAINIRCIDIRERVDAVKKRIERDKKELEELQTICNHPDATLKKEAKSNTGNYDPSSDCYWVEYRCGKCDKFWSLP